MERCNAGVCFTSAALPSYYDVAVIPVTVGLPIRQGIITAAARRLQQMTRRRLGLTSLTDFHNLNDVNNVAAKAEPERQGSKLPQRTSDFSELDPTD